MPHKDPDERRARDARLRAARKTRRDPEKARADERESAGRPTADRAARGVCTKCGGNPAEPDRRLSGPCADKRREADRRRYANARASDLKYGGKNVESKRRSARVVSGKRRGARHETGLCLRCGCRPPAEGGGACNRAGRATKLPSESCTPRGGTPACAPVAAVRPPTATPTVRLAPRWKPSARMPETGNSIGTGIGGDVEPRDIGCEVRFTQPVCASGRGFPFPIGVSHCLPFYVDVSFFCRILWRSTPSPFVRSLGPSAKIRQLRPERCTISLLQTAEGSANSWKTKQSAWAMRNPPCPQSFATRASRRLASATGSSTGNSTTSSPGCARGQLSKSPTRPSTRIPRHMASRD